MYRDPFIKGFWRNKTSLDHPISSENPAQTLQELLADSDCVCPGVAVLCAEEVRSWDDALGRFAAKEHVPAQQRQMVSALRVLLRIQSAVYSSSEETTFSARVEHLKKGNLRGLARRQLIDTAIAELPINVLLKGNELRGWNVRLGESSARGFELEKHSSELLQEILFSKTGTREQNLVKKQLERIVYILNGIRIQGQLSDIFGIAAWACNEWRKKFPQNLRRKLFGELCFRMIFCWERKWISKRELRQAAQQLMPPGISDSQAVPADAFMDYLLGESRFVRLMQMESQEVVTVEWAELFAALHIADRVTAGDEPYVSWLFSLEKNPGASSPPPASRSFVQYLARPELHDLVLTLVGVLPNPMPLLNMIESLKDDSEHYSLRLCRHALQRALAARYAGKGCLL
jgi:hypothetical protein